MRCVAGSTIYSCMLNRRGCVEADLTVSVLSPGADTGLHDPHFDGKSSKRLVTVYYVYVKYILLLLLLLRLRLRR